MHLICHYVTKIILSIIPKKYHELRADTTAECQQQVTYSKDRMKMFDCLDVVCKESNRFVLHDLYNAHDSTSYGRCLLYDMNKLSNQNLLLMYVTQTIINLTIKKIALMSCN